MFLWPIWLLAVAPWSVALIWTLRGRTPAVAVPYLPIWPQRPAIQRAKKNWRRPPLAILLLLLASLLAIFTAAGPVLPSRFLPADSAAIVILDRGQSMSAVLPAGTRIFRQIAAEMQRQLPANLPLCVIDAVSGSSTTITADRLADYVNSLSPTGVDTGDAVRRFVWQSLNREDRPMVLAISDAVLPSVFFDANGAAAVQACMAAPAAVGINLIAARDRPRPQVMLRLLNRSGARSARVVVESSGNRAEQVAALDEAGGLSDCFVDLPGLGKDVFAHIEDQRQMESSAWLARGKAWPSILASERLDEPLRRMIDTYTRLRPAAIDSPSVRVIAPDEPWPADLAAIAAASDSSRVALTPPSWKNVVVSGAPDALASLDWPEIVRSAGLIAPPRDANFKTIVSADGNPVLALDDQTPRRAWLGLVAPGLALRGDYVLLWNGLFTWAGGEAEEYRAAGPQRLAGWAAVAPFAAATAIPAENRSAAEMGLLPGLYQTPAGQIRAINALMDGSPRAQVGDWPAQLRARLGRQRDIRRPLRPILIGLCLFSTGVAMGLLLGKRFVNRRNIDRFADLT